MNHCYGSKLSKGFFRPALVFFLFCTILAVGLPVLAKDHANRTAEQKTALFLESLRDQPGLLYAFLRQMPKGGDLHSHLSGAVYAESMIRWAAEDGLCVDQKTLQATLPPCDALTGRPEAKQAFKDSDFYRKIIDAWSMRNWQYSGQNGHDHFFDTFQKFDIATKNRRGDMLAEVAGRAAAGRVGYLELMVTPEGGSIGALAVRTGWEDDFGLMRSKLLARGMKDILGAVKDEMDRAETVMRQQLKCGSDPSDPGCAVAIRYLYQVLRGLPREIVFAQILAGFELAAADPRFVGLNLVMPEDADIPMSDFPLHMRMLDYFHTLYPGVQLTLHGGELAPGLVPPEGLRFHIRDSVKGAHAGRIGHGVDIMYEEGCFDLLREMARRGILVEILLTSNDVILGVKGNEHPLKTYIRYGVPVALATDDEGVSRSEMTREYQRAVLDQGLGYLQLKRMARNSLEYAFIEGTSLWKNRKITQTVAACARDKPAASLISGACRRFLGENTKAGLQWELEKDFADFEARASKWDADHLP
ncbi:MAG: adenosine deaminase [Pseudomonadota bacterium]